MFAGDLSTLSGRVAAWRDSLFVDHAVFRTVWSNWAAVVPGVLYRSNHPTPARLAQATQGFCYASARMAVTGRAQGSGDAERVVAAVREVSDVPTYVGIGLTTPEQAREASRHCDGVIVGSALVSRILDGASPHETEDLVRSFRETIDNTSV